jgi:hypothetical protein
MVVTQWLGTESSECGDDLWEDIIYQWQQVISVSVAAARFILTACRCSCDWFCRRVQELSMKRFRIYRLGVLFCCDLSRTFISVNFYVCSMYIELM